MKPDVTAFFDKSTFTVTYVVAEPAGNGGERRCAVIDSVRDYDAASGRTSTDSADRLIAFLRAEKLVVDWILDTHPHADHMTAAPYLQQQVGGTIAIGAGVTRVQENFKRIFNLEAEFDCDGSQFEHLFEDGETFSIGALQVEVMATPGHTPACISYLVGDAVFVGDTLFMPDYGSARCDFPDGDARTLYRSVKRILSLPPETRVFTCHDYGPDGREFVWESSVAQQRAENKHMKDGIDEDSFVKMRTERDAGLSMPNLILPSIQVNIRAGAMPPPEDNGISYLKIPIDAL